MLLQGCLSDVIVIDYRYERTVEDKIECREIIYEQYNGDLTVDAEAQIKKDLIAEVKNNKCLIN